MNELSNTDARVLRALPMNIVAPDRWPTCVALSIQLKLEQTVTGSVLHRLRGRRLVEDDGGWPRRWARRAAAEHELENVSG